MHRVLLVIEYDGTDYAGWQLQPNGLSVQEVLEGALAKLTGQRIRLHSSGRTDAGVHARGMAAHFDTSALLPMRAYIRGLNGLLPPAVAVRSAVEVPASFHARFDATGKWYRYSLYCAPSRSPLAARFSWHLRSRPCVQSMREGAAMLVGEHDFAAFRASGCAATDTRREIYSLEIGEDGPLIHIDVRGSGFLRNMVRILAGTLVEIGMGKRTPETLRGLLAAPKRTLAGRTAPAGGLCLMEVWYEGEWGRTANRQQRENCA